MKTIIIGGGAAAMTTASKLRRNDSHAKITVYQADSYVSLGACGIPYYIANDFRNANDLIARTPQQFAQQNIEVFTNYRVVDLDINQKTVTVHNNLTEKQITDKYDNLVIATGASPMIFNFENSSVTNIFTATSLADAIEIKKHATNAKKIAIVGAGFIGLELVETFLHLKKEIILIEGLERILEKNFDHELTTIVHDSLVKSKVKIHVAKKLFGFTGESKVTGIVLDSKETIAADLVILALGFKPNTEIFKEIGLKMLPNGAIIVDEKGRTNIKNIYSVGDCATINHQITKRPEYIPLATTAIKLARVIANVISQREDEFIGTLGSAILRINDLELAKTGINEYQAKTMGIDYEKIIIQDYDIPRYMKASKPLILKIIYSSKDERILGAQMLGSNKAVLRINVLSLAISQKMKVGDLEQLDLVYAPPFSRTNDIIHISARNIKQKKERK